MRLTERGSGRVESYSRADERHGSIYCMQGKVKSWSFVVSFLRNGGKVNGGMREREWGVDFRNHAGGCLKDNFDIR